ncbi:hypothetical protein [Streptosporangium sandarakinum]
MARMTRGQTRGESAGTVPVSNAVPTEPVLSTAVVAGPPGIRT